MKIPYEKGVWFSVPLRDDGYAVGLVARRSQRPGIILSYFFGPFEEPPSLSLIAGLRPEKAVYVARVADLYLVQGRWPLIGSLTDWKETNWPMPFFVRREEPITRRIWLVQYSDEDPAKLLKEDLLKNPPNDSLREAALDGAGAAEIALTKLLNGKRRIPLSEKLQ